MNDPEGLTAPVPTSDQLSLSKRWEEIVTDERNRWTDPETEEKFWADHVDEYEERFIGKPAGLTKIRSLVGQSETVLEIGPGTGRYTRPLARHADSVTAIEASCSMTERLDRTLESADCRDQVSIITDEWPTTDIESHDWVIAGWSLYRQPDLQNCLGRILETATKGFVIVDSPGTLPPHRRIAVREGDRLPSPPPRQAFYTGLLADHGVYPSVETKPKTRRWRADSKDGLLETLLGDDVENPQCKQTALKPWLHSDSDGWYYEYTIPAAIISHVHKSSTQPPESLPTNANTASMEVGR